MRTTSSSRRCGRDRMTETTALIAGRYRLLEPVGKGGMGRVWLAHDEVLHRQVAIKEVVPPAWLTNSERDQLRELTLREARAAARLNHPNVVKIYDVLHSEKWPWIVMEYVPSRSLQKVLEEDGPLPPRVAAEVGLAVLAALQAAHGAGVLHRDVKPHNVLIGADGRVVLTDFGLATLDTDGAITRPGLIATPQYLAPERARLGLSSVESDLWSLGATLYASVEGRTPYARPSVVETLTALATQEPDPLLQAGSLKPVIDGLLRRDPRTRMTSAEVERLLLRAANGQSTDLEARRRRRMRLILAAVLVTAIAAGSGAAVAASRTGGAGGDLNQASQLSTAVQAGVVACEQPPPSDAHPVPTDRPGPPGTPKLVNGFTWYFRPGSFGVGVPIGWRTWSVGSTACFADPRGGRVLAVDPIRPATEDPVEGGRAEERRLIDAGVLPGYALVHLKPLSMAVPAAEWEFTFDSGSVRRRAAALVISHPVADLIVYWATDDADFPPNRALYDVVRASFRPPPPGAGQRLPVFASGSATS
ncbi:MAG: serine/threonine protein kinase [Hamadaea sp.]|nr:serine/threonine protein kinase [Hamadaea sp.]